MPKQQAVTLPDTDVSEVSSSSPQHQVLSLNNTTFTNERLSISISRQNVGTLGHWRWTNTPASLCCSYLIHACPAYICVYVEISVSHLSWCGSLGVPTLPAVLCQAPPPQGLGTLAYLGPSQWGRFKNSSLDFNAWVALWKLPALPHRGLTARLYQPVCESNAFCVLR